MMKTNQKATRLFIMESVELYRILYEMMPQRGPIEIVGELPDYNVSKITDLSPSLSPDVFLLGATQLNPKVIEGLETIRQKYPLMGVVLLLVSLKDEDTEVLRKVAHQGKGGIAVFLKQSLEDLGQLIEITQAVNRGQVVLDPALARSMFGFKAESPFLKALTSREIDIMNLLSRGYTNFAIANKLFIDTKTVEHHLNNVYGKLKADSELSDRHQRVAAARIYLQETGQLSSN